jgi:HEAT repeats
MVARSLGEEGDRPMDLHTYAGVVEDNYQRLADILLSPAPDASKVQRLLSLDLLPAPPIPRGYAIWSEGLLAEAFVCFPTAAFPALCERLRTATAHQDTSRLYKALTMWGDRFATALAAWLASDTLRLQARAIHGLTLYAKGLNALCDAEAPSLETHLHQTNYAELVRVTRDWDLGVAPAALLSGHPRHILAHQVGQMVVAASDEAQRIAMLRCIGRLCVPHHPAPDLAATLATLAAEADSRVLEREAIIALCHLDRTQACAYMRQHWLDGAPQRTMAAELLGLVRTSSAFDILLELMVDPRAETRRKAMASLAAFASEDALRVLTAHQESDPQTQRQLLRSRQELRRRVHRPSAAPWRGPSAIYGVSPLVLLAHVPGQAVFTERALSAALPPGLIADSASSRRYAVELGLFERQGDVYRVSGMGAAVHWVEAYLQAGVQRYGGQPSDAASADVDPGEYGPQHTRF